jgi:predicted DNA-binding transcriptional regulator YafY
VEGYSINKAKLTSEEASILVLMVDIVKSFGEDFAEPFKMLQKKILNNDADSPFYFKLAKSLDYQETDIVKIIKKAIQDKTKLMLTYASRPDEKLSYSFCPLKIVNFDGFWYLLGTNDKKEIRTLKLYDILDVENTNEKFLATKQLDKYINKVLQNSKNIWFEGQRNKKIVIKVEKVIAGYFKNKEILPLQKIVKENKDGSLILESEICKNQEAVQIILQWLPFITVISPKDLKQEIKKMLEIAIKKI